MFAQLPVTTFGGGERPPPPAAGLSLPSTPVAVGRGGTQPGRIDIVQGCQLEGRGAAPDAPFLLRRESNQAVGGIAQIFRRADLTIATTTVLRAAAKAAYQSSARHGSLTVRGRETAGERANCQAV